MDEEEVDQSSGGLYETLPDLSPDFLGAAANDAKDNASGDAKDKLRGGEEAAASSGGLYSSSDNKKSMGEKAKKAETAVTAAKTAVEVTGGKGAGAAVGKIKGLSKAAVPIALLLVLLIVGFTLFAFIGQGSFAKSFKDRLTEDWNSTATSTAARTDNMIDQQLCGGEASAYGDVIYTDTSFTEEQIQDFEDAGFEVSDSGHELVYKKPNGENVVVTCDGRVGQSKTGEMLAQADSAEADVDENADYEAVKEEILADLGLSSDDSVVLGYSAALQDSTVKEGYMKATRAYRGNMSGWYNDMTETMVSRLGISRNNFKDFEKSGDNNVDKAALQNIIDKTAATDASTGGGSLEARVNEVATNSADPNCGISSAFADIEGVVQAEQTRKQVVASALYLEAIDKTTAGGGTYAPLATLTNMMMESGAANSAGVQYLFGGSGVDQNSSSVLDVSAQANGSVISDGNEGEYRSCIYEGNVISHEKKGAISAIGSAFRKAIDAIRRWFGKGAETGVDIASSALSPQMARFNQTRDQTYFNDNDDGEILGNGVLSAGERIMSEKAKTGGQNIGDTSAATAFRRAQQEVIAEEAWYQRQTRSPFDTSSRYTFLGSIAYSLMPLAMSASSLSLTSSVAKLGNLVSNSLSSLLPTSSAISDTELITTQGDCVLLNSTTAIADVYCNPYYVSDLNLSGITPVEAFEAVAGMRYDTEGSYVGGYAYDSKGGGSKCGTKNSATGGTIDVVCREDNDPMYRDGPINTEEVNYEHHWGEKADEIKERLAENELSFYEGEPRGCESNWYHETQFKWVTNPLTGLAERVEYEYYNFDYPIEWTYSRGPTNFEYAGFQSGWPNRLLDGSVGQELAVNDDAPGECQLDFYVDESRQPVVNMYGALALYQIANGQRGSEWGVADNTNVQWLTKADFTLGRIHPCNVGLNASAKDYTSDYEKYCDPYGQWEWSWESGADEDTKEGVVAGSTVLSRWVGGTAYTISNGDAGSVNIGTDTGNFWARFADPTRDNANFWEEMKYYQAFVEMQEWLESIGMLQKSSTYNLISRYYDENPLDQSYEGIIARYSGRSKEQVVAVLDLLDYAEFLAQYDPSELYPTPVPTMDEIEYDNSEVVAQVENAVLGENIIFDELRNRAVAV